MSDGLRIVLVEDEMLLVLQLEMLLEDAAHAVVGTAGSSGEALDVAGQVQADLALVDIHLADGPTGVEVGRALARRMAVVFMTANPRRIPEDFCGAVGVIAKPYTQRGLNEALSYLAGAMRHPPPTLAPPLSLVLAPAFKERWAVAQADPRPIGG